MALREQLGCAWRARHVLLAAHSGRMTGFMQALLDELGAKCARISPCADAETLCRAMTSARISALIVPQLDALAPGQSIPERIGALLRLLDEAREAGIPLVILCSDAAVYRAQRSAWDLEEDAPLGGETAHGLCDSLLQLAADGASRALLGDAVRTVIVRHLPCLGCGHIQTAQYGAWCRALLRGEVLQVAHPGAPGVFIHPLDVCCGALLLGARALLGDTQLAGAFNLGADPENIAANRSAALRFIRENGGTRPIRETEPPYHGALPMLSGAKARFLCGARCLIPAGEALSSLLALERAAQAGPAAEQRHIREAAEAYLSRLP